MVLIFAPARHPHHCADDGHRFVLVDMRRLRLCPFRFHDLPSSLAIEKVDDEPFCRRAASSFRTEAIGIAGSSMHALLALFMCAEEPSALPCRRYGSPRCDCRTIPAGTVRHVAVLAHVAIRVPYIACMQRARVRVCGTPAAACGAKRTRFAGAMGGIAPNEMYGAGACPLSARADGGARDAVLCQHQPRGSARTLRQQRSASSRPAARWRPRKPPCATGSNGSKAVIGAMVWRDSCQSNFNRTNPIAPTGWLEP